MTEQLLGLDGLWAALQAWLVVKPKLRVVFVAAATVVAVWKGADTFLSPPVRSAYLYSPEQAVRPEIEKKKQAMRAQLAKKI